MESSRLPISSSRRARNDRMVACRTIIRVEHGEREINIGAREPHDCTMSGTHRELAGLGEDRIRRERAAATPFASPVPAPPRRSMHACRASQLRCYCQHQVNMRVTRCPGYMLTEVMTFCVLTISMRTLARPVQCGSHCDQLRVFLYSTCCGGRLSAMCCKGARRW